VPAALKKPNRQQEAAEAANRVPGAPRPKRLLQKERFKKPRPQRAAAEAAVKTAPGALTNSRSKSRNKRKPKKAAEAVD
jgi:hypothetical protein